MEQPGVLKNPLEESDSSDGTTTTATDEADSYDFSYFEVTPKGALGPWEGRPGDFLGRSSR